MSPEIANFTPALFWDVDRETVDAHANKRWLIVRVLGYGRLGDWKALRMLYSLAEIVETAQSSRALDVKTVSFLCVLGRVSKESFRCYTLRQSNPTIWNSYFVRGVKVDFVNYPYAWLTDPVCIGGLTLASSQDIGPMKLEAITNRGSKKDFIDLAFLLETFTLSEMLALYAAKYPQGSEYLVLRSLVYFDDAEDDPSPVMLKPLSWDEAKERICDAVRATA